MLFKRIFHPASVLRSWGLRLAVTLVGLSLAISPADAHPLVGSAIHVTARLRIETQRLDIEYAVHFARLAALNEKRRMDADKDGTLSPEEQQQYLDRVAEGLARSILLTYDGQTGTPEMTQREMDLGDARVIPMAASLHLRLTAPLPHLNDHIHRLFFVHRGEWGQTADYITTVATGDGVETFENAELRQLAAFSPDPLSSQYPDRSVDVLLRSANGPPLAELVSHLTAGPPTDQPSTPNPSMHREPGAAADRAEGLLKLVRSGRLNPGLIAWAALTALFLGGAHALEPGHGKTIVAAYLVGHGGHIRHALALGVIVTVTHTLGVIILGVLVLYAYAYVLPDRIVTWLGFASGALIAGIGCYLFGRHTHHHEHVHDHHSHDHHDPHAHSHSHPSRKITWGSLLGLGISGGLVPCPGALVILLTAMTLNQLGLGLILLACFSLGLAAVLIAIGILMVVARPLMDRWSGQGRLLRRLPRISAAVIICLGLGMAGHALIAGGIVSVNL